MTAPGIVEVDVVIPTYNAKELLITCLERLTEDESVARIIVVDDDSSDGTVDALADEFPAVDVVRLTAHRGLAHAFNRGAAVGDCEFVLFLNNDILAHDSAPQRLAEALHADPGAASAGGRLVDPETRHTQAKYQPRRIPGLPELIARLIGIERLWPRNPWTGQHLTEPLDQTRRQRTDRQPAGACLMVRRATLRSAGGWDERYWMWYEDVDMSRRLAAFGPALYVPDAIFEHVGAASTRSWRRHEQHLRLYHGTMVYAQTHLSKMGQIAVAGTMLAVCLPRFVALSLRRDDAAGSYRQLLRSASGMCQFRPVPMPQLRGPRPQVSR